MRLFGDVLRCNGQRSNSGTRSRAPAWCVRPCPRATPRTSDICAGRQRMKALQLGINYGMGVRSFISAPTDTLCRQIGSEVIIRPVAGLIVLPALDVGVVGQAAEHRESVIDVAGEIVFRQRRITAARGGNADLLGSPIEISPLFPAGNFINERMPACVL